MIANNWILLADFCQLSDTDPSFIGTLNEAGLIEIKAENEQSFIHIDEIPKAEKFIRLHYELNINVEGLSAVVLLLERIHEVEVELHEAKKRLRFFTH